MKFTTKTRYSLRILCQLAESELTSPVKNWDIAEKQQISEPYLVQIMLALKSAGYVSTVRGRDGGFVLARKPEEITVLDIIELFEGKIEFSECVKNGRRCKMFGRCPTTGIWAGLAEGLRNNADKITIADIVRNNKIGFVQEYVI